MDCGQEYRLVSWSTFTTVNNYNFTAILTKKMFNLVKMVTAQTVFDTKQSADSQL